MCISAAIHARPGGVRRQYQQLVMDAAAVGSLTTYYWQIVARNAVTNSGPVWQFTTRGVDHLSWNDIPSPQIGKQPFPAIVTAKTR